MVALEKVRAFFEGLEEKYFYRYLIAFLLCVTLIASFIVFRYYKNMRYLIQRVNTINDLREEASTVLEKSLRVEQQRKEVDRMLDEDEDFKILGYFEGLVSQFKLPKPIEKRVTEIDRDENYRESTLDVKFADMNMKQLAQLLQTIEQNKRIYSKTLEITKPKRQPGTIEVNLVIATLHKKTERVE